MSPGITEKDPLIGDVTFKSIERWNSSDTDKEGSEKAVADYHKYTYKKWIFILVCLVSAFVTSGYAMTVGDFDIGFFESFEILWQHITSNVVNKTYDYVIVKYRLPRIVVGLIAGAGLAVAGATMQSLLKNPLADPYTTGVSSGAGFGASLAIVMGAGVVSGQYAIIANAFIFSLIPTFVIISVAKIKNASPTVMIMAGIAVMYIFNAMTTIVKIWADPNSLAALFRWQVGTLSGASWSEVPIMLAVTVAGFIVLQLLSRRLNVLSTGDDSAKSLGVDAEKLRIVCLVVIALVTAAIVSFTGLIGFVGLVAPHIVRIFIGPDNRYLLPASAMFGAALLVIADLVGRTIIAPTVLQVGVITAFIGGPLFLWLIIKKDSKVWG